MNKKEFYRDLLDPEISADDLLGKYNLNRETIFTINNEVGKMSEDIHKKLNVLKQKKVVIESKIARLEMSLVTGITNTKKQKKTEKVTEVAVKETEKDVKSEEKEKLFGFL